MKRALPLIVALVLAVAAFGAAFLVNTGIRMAVRLPADATLDQIEPSETVASSGTSPGPKARPGDESGGPSRTPHARVPSEDEYVNDIVSRNLFDSSQLGKSAVGGGPGGEVVADLNVKLLATIVAEPVEFSSALIADNGKDGAAAGYGIGDKIADAEITAIRQREVEVKRADGSVQVLKMDEEGEEKTAAAAPAGGTGDEGGEQEGITAISETHYQVDRDVLAKYLGDIDALTKMARAIPHRGPDGEIDGYRLSGIRRNSPLSALGIRNGDVIHNVNGKSLASPTDAMGAFQSLQSESSFNFDITRRGQKQTMEYDIK